MLQDVKYTEATKGVVGGTTLIDIYRVGEVPVLRSGNTPYRNLIIKSIEIEFKPYTTAAFIYYDGSMQYEENITNFYAETINKSPQGDTPEVQG